MVGAAIVGWGEWKELCISVRLKAATRDPPKRPHRTSPQHIPYAHPQLDLNTITALSPT